MIEVLRLSVELSTASASAAMPAVAARVSSSAEPSLRIPVRTKGGTHSFYWFNECGVEEDGKSEAFCIEGTVTLDDLVVLDAHEREIPIEAFIADGVRQWDALYAHDERLSVDAQSESQNRAPKWRKWAEGAESAMIPMRDGVTTLPLSV